MQPLYPITAEQQLSFGNSTNTYEETGAARVGLYVPIGEGIDPVGTPWTTRMETLTGFFRGKYTNGIEFLGFIGPTTNDGSDHGGYFEISFAVSYRRLFSA
jgi:hypothetical protein